jgi:hypothetical protein
MVESLFGNRTAEKVLLYLQNYEEGYGKAIADANRIPLNAVQNQLRKLEVGGVIVSQLKGRTRVYTWNPRYPFLKNLRALLEQVFEYMPEKEIKSIYRQRVRPRRAGKPSWTDWRVITP